MIAGTLLAALLVAAFLASAFADVALPAPLPCPHQLRAARLILDAREVPAAYVLVPGAGLALCCPASRSEPWRVILDGREREYASAVAVRAALVAHLAGAA